MANSLSLIWDLIAVDHASGTFDRVGASAGGASASVKGLLEGFGLLAGGAAIGAAVKSAADFQSQMLLIQTQAHDTTDNLGQMSDAVLKLAGETAQAPEALALSLYHVASTGVTGAQALDEVRAAAQLATVAHANLEETTNALTSAVASGIPGVQNMTQAVGELNATVGSGDMKMSDLNEALSSGLLPVVKNYGLSMQDVGAALATFGDLNIRGADAATDLRMAVQAMAVPVRGGQAVLDELGISTGQAVGELGKLKINASQLADDMSSGGLNKALMDLKQHLDDAGVSGNQVGEVLTAAFGKKAGPGMAVLLDQFDRLQQKYAAVNSEGADFQTEWEKTTQTASVAFQRLKDTIDAVGIKAGEVLLPPLTAFATWLTSTGLPAIERFSQDVGKALSSFVHNSDVQAVFSALVTGGRDLVTVLKDVGAVVAGPALGALGGLVKLFTELPAPVQAAVVAFAAFRLLAQTDMWDSLVGRVGAVGTAFKNFGASVSDAYQDAALFVNRNLTEQMGTSVGVLEKAAGAGAAAMTGLKTAGQGVLSVLGGGWGASLLGAGIAISLVTSKFQEGSQATQKWTDALKQGGQAAEDARTAMAAQDTQLAKNDQGFMGLINRIDGYSAVQRAAAGSTADAQTAYDKWYASAGPVARAQLQVNDALQRYNEMADQFGPNSLKAKSAADQLAGAEQNLTTQQNMLNDAEKTQLQRMKDMADAQRAAISDQFAAQKSLDDFNAAVKIGTTDQASLAQMAAAAADAAGRYAADQAKANGVQDTANAYNQAYIKTLQGLSGQLDGPTRASIQAHLDQIDKTVAHNGDLNDIVDKLHLNFRNTWDDNVKIIQGATPEMEAQLRGLGLTVTELPGMPGHPAEIVVTANTDPAYQQLNDFLKQAQALGFVGAIFGISPTGQGPETGQGGLPGLPGIPGKADGGILAGPGTGTSDSMLIRASNGEFVVKANQTAKHLPLLHAINNDMLPGFADGGAVWPAKFGPMWTDAMAAALDRERVIATAAASGGGNVQQWAGVGASALAAEGEGATWLGLMLQRMNQESGGNPAAVNLTDSNAAAGTPSVGLMQVIGPTYQAYKDPRFDVGPYLYGTSIDPMANITAAIRYTESRYGSLSAWGQAGGYDLGTNYVPADGWNFLHRGEAIVPASKNQGSPWQAGSVTVIAQFGDETIEAKAVRVVDRSNQQAALTASAGSSNAIR